MIFSQNLFGFEVVDITEPKFNGQGFGHRSYYHIGDEPIQEISSPEFNDRFKQGTNARHSFPLNKQSFWFRINLSNPLSQPQSIFIWDTHNYAKEVTVYLGQQPVATLLDTNPLRQRIVEIEIPAHTVSTIYINRINNGSQRQTWTFWNDKEKLLTKASALERNWAVVMAVFAMSLLFNFVLYFSFRSKMYMYYMSYLVSMALFTTASLGRIRNRQHIPDRIVSRAYRKHQRHLFHHRFSPTR